MASTTTMPNQPPTPPPPQYSQPLPGPTPAYPTVVPITTQSVTPVPRAPYDRHGARYRLRVVSTGLLTVALIVDVIGHILCRRNQYCYYSVPAIGLCITPFALVWNIAEFVTLRANKIGIHPGAHIAMDFIIMGSLANGAAFDIIFGSESDTAWRSGFIVLAGALEAIATIIHLILFVLACIAVHKWRRAKRLPLLILNNPVVITTTGVSESIGTHPLVVANAGDLNSQVAALPAPPPGMVYLVPAGSVLGNASQPADGKTETKRDMEK